MAAFSRESHRHGDMLIKVVEVETRVKWEADNSTNFLLCLLSRPWADVEFLFFLGGLPFCFLAVFSCWWNHARAPCWRLTPIGPLGARAMRRLSDRPIGPSASSSQAREKLPLSASDLRVCNTKLFVFYFHP